MRVLIVDDERLARRGVRRELERIPGVEIVGECENGLAAVDAIVEQGPDLVLLDVQMPGLTGFDVIERIGIEAMPAVIFVTAYDRHALKAFEVHALDYVLKPIDPDRFRDAFERATRLIERDQRPSVGKLQSLLHDVVPGQGADAGIALERVVIREAGRLFFVEAATIEWVEAAGNYVKLHVGARSHLLRSTMDRMAGRLGATRFVRIRRSVLVNVRAIATLTPYGKGSYTITLRGGGTLVSSRYYAHQLRELFARSR